MSENNMLSKFKWTNCGRNNMKLTTLSHFLQIVLFTYTDFVVLQF